MRTTDEVVIALSSNLTPVRRQASPLLREMLWLALAALVLVFLAMGHGLRPNLTARLGEWPFRLELIGASLTGVAAAFAAFTSGIPGRSRWWMLLPLPPLALWMAVIGQQCLTRWVETGPEGMSFGESAECLATVGLTSLPLSLALVVMLRHAAVMRPFASYLLGSLAVAGMAGAAMLLLHALDASVMVIVFNVASTLVLVAIATVVATLNAQSRRNAG